MRLVLITFLPQPFTLILIYNDLYSSIKDFSWFLSAVFFVLLFLGVQQQEQ